MDSTKQVMNPRDAEENEKTDEREAKEVVDRVMEAFDQLPPGIDHMPYFRALIRPMLQDLAPAERREMLNDMKPCFTVEDHGNGTGKFFCALAGTKGVREPDYVALGKKIMRKRNPNYKEE